MRLCGKESIEVYCKLGACWERALEGGAFIRIIQRHRDHIGTKHIKKVS